MTRPVVQSYEAWIESKAGACPGPDDDVPTCAVCGLTDRCNCGGDDWPMERPPPFSADDENDESPVCVTGVVTP